MTAAETHMEESFGKSVGPNKLDLFKEKLRKVLNSPQKIIKTGQSDRMGDLEYENSVRLVRARMSELKNKLGIDNDCN